MLCIAPETAGVTLLLALALDGLVGDPGWLYRRVPHPVVLIGRAIAAGERRLNRAGRGERARILAGTGLTAAVVAGAAAIGLALHGMLAALPHAWPLEAVLASTLLAYRGLYDAVRRVAESLGNSLAEGRGAVAVLAGRDTRGMDEAAVARAGVESAAENLADGVVAPAFWYLVLGLPGILAYKAVNTLDSMLGHRDERHAAFGRAAARLDDVASWPCARLTALLLCLGGVFVGGARPDRALWTAVRDARRHRSVNAGWPEAAMAGALGFALAGPRSYGGESVPDAWMGRGRAALTPADVHRALTLYVAAGGVLAVAVGGLTLAV